MGSTLEKLRHAFTATVFLVLFATLIAHHAGAAEIAFLVCIAALFVGGPMASAAWARRQLRQRGDALARQLSAEGRLGQDGYELRLGGRVARWFSSKDDGVSVTVVTVDSGAPQFGLNITHETNQTAWRVARGQAMDLDLGHPILDPALSIEGGPLAAVRGILLDPRVLPALLELAAHKSLRISARDGLVRVSIAVSELDSLLVQLALGIAEASHEHATNDDDPARDRAWAEFQDLEQRRAERKEQYTAWVSQSLATFIAVMIAIKAGGASNMKMNLGPIELLGVVFMALGLPRLTGDLVGTAGVAWFGFAIPAVMRFSKLGHGSPRGSNPIWSFVLSPIVLVCLVSAYEAESSAPAPKPQTSPPASLASTHPKPGTAAPKPKPKSLSGTFHDTEARAFKFTCPKGGSLVDTCKVTGASTLVAPQSKAQSFGRTPAFGLVESALINVCDGVEDTSNKLTPTPNGCRAVTCSTADDCPRSDLGTSPIVCSHGLCESISGKLTHTDVASLCLAGVGVAFDGPDVAQRMLLANAACDSSSCSVATECKQP